MLRFFSSVLYNAIPKSQVLMLTGPRSKPVEFGTLAEADELLFFLSNVLRNKKKTSERTVYVICL